MKKLIEHALEVIIVHYHVVIKSVCATHFILVLIFALERTSREHIGNNNHHYGNIKKYYRLFDVNITFFFLRVDIFLYVRHIQWKRKKITFSSLTTTIYYRAPRHNSCIYTIDTLCFFLSLFLCCVISDLFCHILN